MVYLALFVGVVIGAIGSGFIVHKIMNDISSVERSEAIKSMKDYINELEINNEHLKEQNNKLKEALNKC